MRSVNKPLKILLFTDSMVLIAAAMLVPFYTAFVEQIGGDILDAGIAASLFAVAAGISSLLAGRWSDRVQRKEFIVAAGYLVTAVGFALYFFVTSMWHLLAVQVLIGLAQASYAPAYDTLYARHVGSTKHSSSRWSLWESLNYFSIAAGALIGTAILKFADFRILFVFMACLCTFSGIYIATRPKRLL